MYTRSLLVPWLTRATGALAVSLFVSACGSTPPPETPTSPPPVPTDEPVEQAIDETATLDVYGNPPTPILLDGKPIGTTPISGYKVSPGSHDVTFVDELSGNRTMSVEVSPGEARAVTSDRPPSAMPENTAGGGK